jgi:lactoylglutathione lyase
MVRDSSWGDSAAPLPTGAVDTGVVGQPESSRRAEERSAMEPAGRVKELRVVLTVKDFDAAVAFYRDALGLQEVLSWESPHGSGLMLSAGKATLELLSSGEAEYVDQVEVGQRVGAQVRLGAEVDDSEAAAGELEKAGAEMLASPRTTPWSHRSVRLSTPEGLHLTLFTPISSP